MKIEEIKEKILPILRKYQVSRAGVFGSVVRGEETEDSDVDILVEIERDDISLLDFVGIEFELSEALGRKVDLIEYSAIHPLLKRQILKEELKLL
jgi:predicted nucleotidyltransferase